MIRRRTLMAFMGLLLACGPSASSFAQDTGLYAPLIWTRGDLKTYSFPAQSALRPQPSRPLASEVPPRITPPYDQLIDSVAQEHHLDPRLLHAMIHVESRYQQNALSIKGAVGLMQVMPATGERFGYTDLSNAPNNLRAGAAYLKWLLNHFDHNLELSIAAYNAREGAVKKYGRQIPPYPETRDYVSRVMTRYREGPMTFPASNRTSKPGTRATKKPSAALHSAAAYLQTVGALLPTTPAHNEG